MLRDHQLFVRGDHIDRDFAAGRGYQRPSRGIGVIVQFDAKPSELLGDAAADHGRILTDAGGENKRIQSAERRRQHPGAESGAMNEIVDGKLRAWLLVGLQLAHVVADARETLQTTLAVEQILHVRGVHAFLHDEIKHHTGIDLAGPRAHRQAVQSGEPHCAVDAAAIEERTHRCATAEMSDDDTRVGDFRRDRLQAIGDIFIGEAVEAVAANALRVETFRQGEMVGNCAMTAVESRIEAGDLRQLRKARAERLHGGEIVRLMKRRQRDVALEFVEDGRVDEDRPVIFRSAVHDAVPDSRGLKLLFLTQPSAGDR